MLFNYYYLTLLNHYLLFITEFFQQRKIQIILWNILVTIFAAAYRLPLYIYNYYNWRVLPQLTSTYYLSSLLLQLHTFQYLLTTPPVLQCHSFAAGRSKYYFEGLTSLHPSPYQTLLYSTSVKWFPIFRFVEFWFSILIWFLLDFSLEILIDNNNNNCLVRQRNWCEDISLMNLYGIRVLSTDYDNDDDNLLIM